MRNFNVIILNGADIEVYEKSFKAKDENEAIKEMLQDVFLADGDTIKIIEF